MPRREASRILVRRPQSTDETIVASRIAIPKYARAMNQVSSDTMVRLFASIAGVLI